MEFFPEDQLSVLNARLWAARGANSNLRSETALQIAEDYAAEIGIDLRGMAVSEVRE